MPFLSRHDDTTWTHGGFSLEACFEVGSIGTCPDFNVDAIVGPRLLATMSIVAVFMGISRRVLYGKATDSTMPVKIEL